MKILDVTSFVTASIYQPGKAPSINFIEDAYQETSLWNASAEILNLNNASEVFPNQPYAMYGCFAFYVSPTYIVNSGVILYQGILYNVNAASVTTLTEGFMCATFSVTNSGALDPTEFSDGSFHNVHNDTSISWFHSASASALTPGALFDTTQINYLTTVPQQITNYNNSIIGPPTRFTLPVSGTGWTQGFITASYTKDAFGIVRMNGVMTQTLGTGSTLGTYATNLFTTLPAGYRPNNNITLPACYTNAVTGTTSVVSVQIGTTGLTQIIIPASGNVGPSASYILIDNLTFPIW